MPVHDQHETLGYNRYLNDLAKALNSRNIFEAGRPCSAIVASLLQVGELVKLMPFLRLDFALSQLTYQQATAHIENQMKRFSEMQTLVDDYIVSFTNSSEVIRLIFNGATFQTIPLLTALTLPLTFSRQPMVCNDISTVADKVRLLALQFIPLRVICGLAHGLNYSLQNSKKPVFDEKVCLALASLLAELPGGQAMAVKVMGAAWKNFYSRTVTNKEASEFAQEAAEIAAQVGLPRLALAAYQTSLEPHTGYTNTPPTIRLAANHCLRLDTDDPWPNVYELGNVANVRVELSRRASEAATAASRAACAAAQAAGRQMQVELCVPEDEERLDEVVSKAHATLWRTLCHVYPGTTPDCPHFGDYGCNQPRRLPGGLPGLYSQKFDETKQNVVSALTTVARFAQDLYNFGEQNDDGDYTTHAISLRTRMLMFAGHAAQALETTRGRTTASVWEFGTVNPAEVASVINNALGFNCDALRRELCSLVPPLGTDTSTTDVSPLLPQHPYAAAVLKRELIEFITVFSEETQRHAVTFLSSAQQFFTKFTDYPPPFPLSRGLPNLHWAQDQDPESFGDALAFMLATIGELLQMFTYEVVDFTVTSSLVGLSCALLALWTVVDSDDKAKHKVCLSVVDSKRMVQTDFPARTEKLNDVLPCFVDVLSEVLAANTPLPLPSSQKYFVQGKLSNLMTDHVEYVLDPERLFRDCCDDHGPLGGYAVRLANICSNRLGVMKPPETRPSQILQLGLSQRLPPPPPLPQQQQQHKFGSSEQFSSVMRNCFAYVNNILIVLLPDFDSQGPGWIKLPALPPRVAHAAPTNHGKDSTFDLRREFVMNLQDTLFDVGKDDYTELIAQLTLQKTLHKEEPKTELPFGRDYSVPAKTKRHVKIQRPVELDSDFLPSSLEPRRGSPSLLTEEPELGLGGNLDDPSILSQMMEAENMSTNKYEQVDSMPNISLPSLPPLPPPLMPQHLPPAPPPRPPLPPPPPMPPVPPARAAGLVNTQTVSSDVSRIVSSLESRAALIRQLSMQQEQELSELKRKLNIS